MRQAGETPMNLTSSKHGSVVILLREVREWGTKFQLHPLNIGPTLGPTPNPEVFTGRTLPLALKSWLI